MEEIESLETSTHYIAKVGNMFVSNLWTFSSSIKLSWAELDAMKLTKEEAEFCKRHAGANIKGVKVEVTYFDNEFE